MSPPRQRAKPATRKEMAQFHTDEYVDFLARITPDLMDNFAREQAKCGVALLLKVQLR